MLIAGRDLAPLLNDTWLLISNNSRLLDLRTDVFISNQIIGTSVLIHTQTEKLLFISAIKKVASFYYLRLVIYGGISHNTRKNRFV